MPEEYPRRYEPLMELQCACGFRVRMTERSLAQLVDYRCPQCRTFIEITQAGVVDFAPIEQWVREAVEEWSVRAEVEAMDWPEVIGE